MKMNVKILEYMIFKISSNFFYSFFDFRNQVNPFRNAMIQWNVKNGKAQHCLNLRQSAILAQLNYLQVNS